MRKQLLALTLFALPLLASSLPPTLTCAAPTTSKLGDLSVFEGIANDTLVLVNKGDLKAAEKRITDFETAWDNAHTKLRPLDTNAWGVVDDAADVAIASLRASKPTLPKAKAAVTALISAIRNPSTH